MVDPYASSKLGLLNEHIDLVVRQLLPQTHHDTPEIRLADEAAFLLVEKSK